MKKGCILIILGVILLINLSSAEKLSIEIGDSYTPGEEIKFRLTLYDDEANPIQGTINYEIQDFLREPIYRGAADSEQEIIFELPTNTERGYAAMVATYRDLEQKQLFNVNELEKAEIILQEDRLTITNIGNIPYTKSIQISIGENHQTAYVPLEVGQIKEIKLTAPPGKYNIKVSDGTEENTFEIGKIALTGDVVGLEKVSQEGFLKKYPLVSLFLLALVMLITVIFILRKPYTNIKNKNKTKRK